MKSRLAAAAAAILATATLAGCNFITPQATQFQYDPADGVSGATGPVEIRNAVLVVDGDLSSLAVTFVNDGPATTLEVTVGDESQSIDLDSGLTPYGFPDQQLVFSAPVTAGTLEDVVFAADAAERTAVPVPVFSVDVANWSSYGPVAPEEDEAEPSTPASSEPAPSDGSSEGTSGTDFEDGTQQSEDEGSTP
ncbi:hypothetical protein [Agrococcus sp. SGAir0287]|uniref:hypothetical protein n=1 Tax=Agrococcus sp. SGAir0287 TaxID=2070347 RepID=UPI0010CCEACA|nr:hypothetical protein [Agrococcus sp. SGAir0287]QCR19920.1 hypothetical protein C1N71_11150 [Agrococcus sp. SGAir0287]